MWRMQEDKFGREINKFDSIKLKVPKIIHRSELKN